MKTQIIDITSLKYQEPFKFPGGTRVYWAIGYCNNHEQFEYCDSKNKKFKADAILPQKVRRIAE